VLFFNLARLLVALIGCESHPPEQKVYRVGYNQERVFFTTRTLKALSSDYADTTKAYATTQSGLVKEVVTIACEFDPTRGIRV
jgi:hypothetical protein